MVGGSINCRTNASVDIYDIAEGTWKDGPALKEARYRNSSCQQGDFIYTFGGMDTYNMKLSSIE